jgi:exodeoxyribonuclease V alpha subunit
MVDVVLMDRLLDALTPDTKVVFLGDPNQLPPVEGGAVLGDLVPCEQTPAYSRDTLNEWERLGAPLATPEPADARPSLRDRIVLLRESHRFEGHLKETAEAFRTGLASWLSPYNAGTGRGIHGVRLEPVRHAAGEGRDGKTRVLREAWAADWQSEEWLHTCRVIDAEGHPAGVLRDIAYSWSHAFFADGRSATSYRDLARAPFDETHLASPDGIVNDPRVRGMFERLERTQILTLLRGGPYGCTGINRHLSRSWSAEFDPEARPGGGVFSGAPIMVTRNSAAQELYNGDVGIAVRTRGGQYAVLFRRADRYLAYPYESLPEHELAFACTVHKSQGSQYGRVLIIMPPGEAHPLLSREIVYTGITRARECAVIYSRTEVLQKAIDTPITRYSGLDLWAGDPLRPDT